MGTRFGVTTKTAEDFVFYVLENAVKIQGTLLSSLVDAGETPTTMLRAGLALGVSTASGKWGLYDSTASDGRETFRGCLADHHTNMLDADGNAAETEALILVAGVVDQTRFLEVNTGLTLSIASLVSDKPAISFETLNI